MKDERGFGKTWYFFSLNSLFMMIWDMSNGFMTDWVTPRSL